MYQPQLLPFKKGLKGISDKTVSIHHDKLYIGYVNKRNEIHNKLSEIEHNDPGKLDAANQTFSELRALKDGETFAVNGVYLHEYYFNSLGGTGTPVGSLATDLAKVYGSLDNFTRYFKACGMSARGWVVLGWDTHLGELRVYTGDAHNQGGVWGCIPIIVLDVYEHAYFIDYGADRKAYVEDFMVNLNWDAVNEVYEKVKAFNR